MIYLQGFRKVKEQTPQLCLEAVKHSKIIYNCETSLAISAGGVDSSKNSRKFA